MASDPAGDLLPKLGDRSPVRCMAPDLVGLGSSGVQDVDLASGEVRGFCLASQSWPGPWDSKCWPGFWWSRRL